MLNKNVIAILNKVASGEMTPSAAYSQISLEPYEELGFAKVDHFRSIRTGCPEIIYGEGKSVEQICAIVSSLHNKQPNDIIVTRISPEAAAAIRELYGDDFQYFPDARIAVAHYDKNKTLKGNIIVASAGTSDIPVCEEAAVTAEILGSRVNRIYDIGIAGIQRLFQNLPLLRQARVIIAVAGMEGALPGVIAGLVNSPVIAVPTSVGYGTNFDGITPLLTMLNSCANGIAVVNIDNGFGAAYLANMINQMDNPE